MKEKQSRYDCVWRTNGKQRGKTVDTKHAATRFLASVVVETHSGTYKLAKPLTMHEVFDKWQQHLDVKLQQGRFKPSTMKAYLSILRTHLRPAFGACRSDQLSDAVVLEWERQCAPHLADGSLGKRHYNNIIRVLATALKWARQRGQRYLSHDPLTDVKPVPVPRRERRFLEPEEIARLLDAPDNERDRAIMYLFTYSGLRRGELFGLQWGDLDTTTNRLHVRRGLSAGVVTSPKTPHSARTVDLPTPIVARLVAYRETAPPRSPKGFMFHIQGRHLSADNWYKRAFVPAVQRAGLRSSEQDADDGQAVSIHSLRHTYASTLINQGESIHYVSRQLGHAKISVTADTYGHLFRETSVSAMERLAQQVHGVSPDTR